MQHYLILFCTSIKQGKKTKQGFFQRFCSFHLLRSFFCGFSTKQNFLFASLCYSLNNNNKKTDLDKKSTCFSYSRSLNCFHLKILRTTYTTCINLQQIHTQKNRGKKLKDEIHSQHPTETK